MSKSKLTPEEQEIIETYIILCRESDARDEEVRKRGGAFPIGESYIGERPNDFAGFYAKHPELIDRWLKERYTQ